MSLSTLNKDLLLKLWPSDRVHIGLASSSWLRAILVKAEKVELHLHSGLCTGEGPKALSALLSRLEGSIFVSASFCDCNTVLQGLEHAQVSGWSGPSGIQVIKPVGSFIVRPAAALSHMKHALSCWRELKSLNLFGLNLSIGGAKELSRALQAMESRQLQSLELGLNNMQDVGLAQVVEALQGHQCSSLTQLGLSLNQITEKGVACLSTLLPQLASLEDLSLGQNHISDSGMAHLVEGWRHGPAIRRLDLGGNRLGEEGLALFAGVGACKERCAALTALDLSYNRIDAAGSAHLPALLRCCPNLRSLDVSHNAGGSAGGSLWGVSGVLAECERLGELRVGGNGIDDAGATELAAALAQCPALAQLSVRNNRIADAGLAALAAAMAQCATAAVLDAAFNAVSGEGEAGEALWQALAGVRLREVDLSFNKVDAARAQSMHALPALKLQGCG